ncbi:Long-chain-fatty-acid--CoA ligase [Crocosphaera watsonii WH 0402]|uniref:Long-chain-fatty-acid--CoA ligase n=1 Tax=Crocosphaera watsonii WH 0402 TaxID=1284629 RepID=T2JG39_CROWT|nr:fatty acyl-AMP ligase [Crocosphaera watsonii]CCQ64803.1 Long-chain-fatty-acid--CoA ligase [Crocosphaera watsonii WH 0402]
MYQVKYSPCLAAEESFVSLLKERAAYQSSKTAYTFLSSGKTEESSLTYQQLDRKARELGAILYGLGLKGERALLMYNPGLDFVVAFFACLYAGVIAVPVYPPKRNQSFHRLQAIIKDCDAKEILTTSNILSNLQQGLIDRHELHSLKFLATDNLPIQFSQTYNLPEIGITQKDLAFLQYTSGSTGNPKGVMVTHQNLLVNCEEMNRVFNHQLNSVMVTWLPTFHDMGLIYGVLEPLYKGITCYMMAPVSFIQSPFRWLQAISHYKGTHSAAPNFAYDLCTRKITSEQKASLDLSSWKMTLNGAEPIRYDVLERFTQEFASCGFNPTAMSPGYGLAEATLFVSAVHKEDTAEFYRVQAEALQRNKVVKAEQNDDSAVTLVGCGKTEIDTQIVIVNPDTLTSCKKDEIGEIWVSGKTVAQGYWQKEAETAKTFQAKLASGEGPFLRTGDLGFLKDGELFVTGRLKDVLIIRGRNHYPQDIEMTVEQCHPALRPGYGAAFTVETDGKERLVIVQEVERTYLRKINIKEVQEAIRKAVTKDHGLQVHDIVLIRTATIPKTSSGKIQRSRCKEQFLRNTSDDLFVVKSSKVQLS